MEGFPCKKNLMELITPQIITRRRLSDKDMLYYDPFYTVVSMIVEHIKMKINFMQCFELSSFSIVGFLTDWVAENN